MKKNKAVLILSVVASLLFVIFLVYTADNLGKVDYTLATSANVENVTDKILTKILISKTELNDDWFKESFNDQAWKSIHIPKDWIPKEPGFEQGSFIYYRIFVPKVAIQKLSHLKNESVLSLYYVLFSQIDSYANGKFYQTNKPTDYNESILDFPIIENQDNLIAFRGLIKTGDSGVNHRGQIFAGKKAELNELHRKSYKGQTVFSLIFILCKGSILLIFTLIFLVVRVEKYFEKFLLFSMFVILEDILTGDYISHLLNFHQMVYLYDFANLGLIICLFLFLSDVIEREVSRRSILTLSGVLILSSMLITTDVLYFSKFFGIDHFLKFWNCILIITLIFFIPKVTRGHKVLGVALSVATLLTAWSAFFSSNVAHNLKAFANLLIFIFVAYETFLLFSKQQQQLSEQEKDVAIGKTAAVLAHDVRRPLDQMNLILNRIIEGDADKEFLRVAQEDIQYSLNSVNNQISDVMNFSRSKELSLRPVSLYGVLQGSLKQVMSVTTNVDIKLEYDFKSKNLILAEESRLGSAITNVLANAIEAIRDIGKMPSGTIRISTQIDNGNVILKISNSGPSIPNHILSEIFKPLFTSGKSRGTGLGLASVAKIMKDHKGDIKVENLKDFVEFTFSFKIVELIEDINFNDFKKTAKEFGYVPKIVSDKKSLLRVFVLDDDKYVFEYLKDLAVKCDYKVELTTFRNILDAETAIKSKRFDLHLIDHDLGESQSGLDFYTNNLRHLNTVVALHSGRKDISLPNSNIQAVPKPIDLTSFNRILALADKRRLKVLLIEDSKLIGVAWKLFHGNENIHVCSSPEEGISYFRENFDKIDICVVDYYFDNSPLIGDVVVKELRNIEQNLKFFLMTSADIQSPEVPVISKSAYEVRTV